jgi:ferredoxin-NADP reductase
MEVVPDDRSGTRAAERFFEIEVEPAAGGPVRFLPGQRVVVRFELSEKPLALQAWRWLLQLIQRRFHI